MSEGEAEQRIKDRYQVVTEHLRNRGARVVVMGSTGTGKTSLINAAFGKQRGRVGHGRPTTQSIEMYPPDEHCPVWVYDTKGFEALSDNKDIAEDLKNLYDEHVQKAKKNPPDSAEYHAECLHAVWWVTTERLEDRLQDQVREIFKEVPIFIVVNKCDKKEQEVDQVLNDVARLCPWAAAVIPVVSTPKNGPLKKKCETCGSTRISVMEDEGYECRNPSCNMCHQNVPLKLHYGIDKLFRETVVRLPEMVAESFHEAESTFLNDLDSMASRRIAIHCVMAAGVGACPIPFSDFPLLVANEVAMFGNLGAVYGLKVDPVVAKEVLSAFSGVMTGAGAGLALGSAIKLIPIVGSVLGGCTDVFIATTVTGAVGTVVKELLRRVRREAVFGEVTAEHFKKVMGVDEMKRHFQEALGLERRGQGYASQAAPALQNSG